MPENYTIFQDRLHKLRSEIQNSGLSGFILPRTDEFQGEFLAQYAQRLSWLTGFTGSAGTGVVLLNKAVVLSDGRYTIQMRNEIQADLYETGNSTEISAQEWIINNAQKGERIGFDPWLHTVKQTEGLKVALEESGIILVPVEKNFIDVIREELPERSHASVLLFPVTAAGRSSEEKCDLVRAELKKNDADAMVLSAADSVCWLLNVRGGDVDYTPLVHSYVIIHRDAPPEWFVEELKITSPVRKAFSGKIDIRRFDEFPERLAQFTGKKIAVDFSDISQGVRNCLAGAIVCDVKDPCIYARSIKTAQECEAVRQAHIADAVALDKFLRWFEEEVPKETLCEISVAEKLEEFRAQNPNYRGMSFPTICGFAENGAIIHYRADERSNKKIIGNGLLLLDSGGQYEWGTTDITRTIAVGVPTPEMKRVYTLVLKGHIAVSAARFPKGTTGAQIDALARQPLWREGLDYPHGTGHGVGCYLGVHEAAASLSPRTVAAVEPGMVLSNEPGYYSDGQFGIRIENLVLAQEAGICRETGKEMVSFETLTFARYDERLLIAEMLDESERAWLKNYHAKLDDIFRKHG